jgi:hypothetical protein
MVEVERDDADLEQHHPTDRHGGELRVAQAVRVHHEEHAEGDDSRNQRRA